MPLTWLALFLLAGGIAACMNLGTLHDGQTADSVLLSLISTQRWTPFYWGQDRYGMLIPLLAMPARSPLANLLLQGWMTTTAALLVPFLVARFLCGSAQTWIAAGALANALLVLLLSPYLQFEWFVAQPYALAMALGFASLLMIEAARGWAARVAALLLMILAHWVNVSAVIAIGSALLLRGGSAGTLTVTGLGVAGGILAALLAPVPSTTTALTPIANWPQGWLGLLRTTWGSLAHAWLLGPLTAATALGGLRLWKQGERGQMRVATAAAGAALVNWLAVGTFEWVRLNLYFPRYALPSLLMLAVAAAILFALPTRRYATPISGGAWLALAALTFLLYGPPSLERVERGLDQHLGRMTPEILSSRATLIAGDYWTVWPAVFHANLRLHENGADAVLGLAFRSSVTNDLWLGRAGPILVATAPDDGSAAELAAGVGLQLSLVEHRSSIDLFTATSASRAADSLR